MWYWQWKQSFMSSLGLRWWVVGITCRKQWLSVCARARWRDPWIPPGKNSRELLVPRAKSQEVLKVYIPSQPARYAARGVHTTIHIPHAPRPPQGRIVRGFCWGWS
ncbi:hypothetical protein F4778DRAFT_679852 [Xylariomycetidae sp. FL2044]|nr:hypothetical protein F4778DRAFT_679852 [Xylariomycetidae sp. FL2044]